MERQAYWMLCLMALGLLGAGAIEPAKAPDGVRLELMRDVDCTKMPEPPRSSWREPLPIVGPDGGLWIADRADAGVAP